MEVNFVQRPPILLGQKGLDHPARSLTGGYLINSALNYIRKEDHGGPTGTDWGSFLYRGSK